MTQARGAVCGRGYRNLEEFGRLSWYTSHFARSDIMIRSRCFFVRQSYCRWFSAEVAKKAMLAIVDSSEGRFGERP